MNLEPKKPTQGTTLLTIPAASSGDTTVNVCDVPVPERDESVYTRFLYHSTSAALRRGATSKRP
jgi:hypothetical protein